MMERTGKQSRKRKERKCPREISRFIDIRSGIDLD